jgi:hypothetical protein
MYGSRRIRGSRFDAIAMTIGEQAARRLVADFGGTRLYVPLAPRRGHRVAASIGFMAARRLGRIYGGELLDVPMNADWGGCKARILELRGAGRSVRQIVNQLHCSRRYVFKTLALMRG